MKSLTLALMIASLGSIASANCPQLAGVYQVGPSATATVLQGKCALLTFVVQNHTYKVAINGRPQPTGDGAFEKYEWQNQSLVETPVSQDGEVIRGLITTYTPNAERDLVVQTVIGGKAGKPQIWKRVSP